MLNRRLAVVSGLAVLSAVAFAPKAGAQTVDINFSGTVTGTCAFSGTTAGALGQNSPNSWVEGAGGIPGMSTAFSAATTTVNCTSGGTVSVSAPVKVAAPAAFVDTVKQALVYDATANAYTSAGGPFDSVLWNQTTAPLAIPANTNRTLRVGVVAGVRNFGVGAPPAGTYNYKVTLTATPN